MSYNWATANGLHRQGLGAHDIAHCQPRKTHLAHNCKKSTNQHGLGQNFYALCALLNRALAGSICFVQMHPWACWCAPSKFGCLTVANRNCEIATKAEILMKFIKPASTSNWCPTFFNFTLYITSTMQQLRAVSAARPPTSVAPGFLGCLVASRPGPAPSAVAPAARSGWPRPCVAGSPRRKPWGKWSKNTADHSPGVATTGLFVGPKTTVIWKVTF